MRNPDYTDMILDGYTIGDLINAGSMATVLHAKHPKHKTPLTIKIMSPQLAERGTFIARFHQEAKTLAKLEHPFIIPILASGDDQGLYYMITPYLSGGDLTHYIPKRGMVIKTAVKVFNRIAGALDYAHTRGIIHRDMKPDNILLDEAGKAYLGDFGLAKSLAGAESLTGTGSVVGTPDYLSPEQGRGEAVDARTDVYGIGVVFFMMLTGQLPFDEINPMRAMMKHINEPPPDPQSIRPDLSDRLRDVLLRSLEKKPDDRYQSAGDMINAVQIAMYMQDK